MSVFAQYGNQPIFKYFEEISAIPRESGNEQGIADYLTAFAEERGLWCYRDSWHNVLIKKPAQNSTADPLILQAHTDMVCEKNSGTQHDFATDPLKLYIEEGWLRAEGTTLGADNGAGVAMMLAMLDSCDIPHPPLECLFTSQEEVGLVGVDKFDFSQLTARRMINLDSSNEGQATIACAGGANVSFVKEAQTVPHQNSNIKIKIRGLFGGHSGADIHRGRSNAIKIMGELLSMLYEQEEFNLVSVECDGKNNAIPRECTAIISVLDRDAATGRLLQLEAGIKANLVAEDEGFHLHVSRCGKTEDMLTYKDTRELLTFMNLVPCGMLSAKSPEVANYSANIGIALSVGATFTFGVYLRYHCDFGMGAMLCSLEQLCKLCRMTMATMGAYPAWEETKGSALVAQFLREGEAVYGREVTAKVFHAGLECGLIIVGLGGKCDAVSFGPEIRDLHTPDERMCVQSFVKTWELLQRMV
ncbi:MAG: beta-Ala-His dipeptidase [Oscillospiraceae bacterium]|nr:beta-Ala-His dipeptidase [Oscillospiraceae bacterium]